MTSPTPLPDDGHGRCGDTDEQCANKREDGGHGVTGGQHVNKREDDGRRGITDGWCTFD